MNANDLLDYRTKMPAQIAQIAQMILNTKKTANDVFIIIINKCGKTKRKIKHIYQWKFISVMINVKRAKIDVVRLCVMLYALCDDGSVNKSQRTNYETKSLRTNIKYTYTKI